MLPGDPNSEFSSADVGEARDDSDVDVDGLMELDGKGEVITGFYGKVSSCVFLLALVWCRARQGVRSPGARGRESG